MTRTFIAIAVTLATLSSAQAQQTIEADNGAVYRIIQTSGLYTRRRHNWPCL
jgi:hypothetical protein